jgi:hypothetical protein
MSISSDNCLAVKHQANWRIRDPDNPFLQARIDLGWIGGILVINAMRRARRETEAIPTA